ncbi:MFS transporter [Paroceanicella profunda]|uniref:MFS transporter n=1 Tax=Paroceanicella profunda TaxID=2579971 RepID=A0A5B8FW46_9RHOB|nr:MFS transporter [Paroceanicella profunda]QDL93066.1 MFS transporter [Paroceanicella profunda]
MDEGLRDMPARARARIGGPVYPVLGAASVCHLLNDMLQSLFIATYPVFRSGFDLSFGQIGLLTLSYQLTASLLQPLVGLATDRRPQPFSLPVGMGASAAGLLLLSMATSYAMLLAGGALLGVGSSIFHPEASRLARRASGGAHGLAQSIFQVGGNVGSSLGPLLVAFIVLPHGQASLGWFALAGVGGVALLTWLGLWSRRNGAARPGRRGQAAAGMVLPRRQVLGALGLLFWLILSKWFYLASFTSYYVFYLMEEFAVPEEAAQLWLFLFLAAVAAGTLIGGPLGDRIGRKPVIWGSILGTLPFALVLPHVGLAATVALSVPIGLIISSAFSAIVVYAQELVPGRVGMVSGLFFGLAFGLGGLGAAVLGLLADATSIGFVYDLCSVLPAMGALALLLPDPDPQRDRRST